MNKLSTKFLIASIIAFISFCAYACSNQVTGTAEEPNQIVAVNGSSSSSDPILKPHFCSDSKQQGTDGSSITHPGGYGNPGNLSSGILISSKSSSSSPPQGHSNPNMSSATSITIISGNAGNNWNLTGCWTQQDNSVTVQCSDAKLNDSVRTHSFDTYLDYFRTQEHISDSIELHQGQMGGLAGSVDTIKAKNVSFAKNIISYNVTFNSMKNTDTLSPEGSKIAVYRSFGLHKVATMDTAYIDSLFPLAASITKAILRDFGTCSAYVLNTYNVEPAGHVVTSITKDSISIVHLNDRCDYGKKPYDTYVGFLFISCDDIPEDTPIVSTNIVVDKIGCLNIKETEWFNTHIEISLATK